MARRLPMRGTRCLLALAALLCSSTGAAAGRQDVRVRCDSVGGRWQHCDAGFAGDARLLRQLSRTACIRNQSWGRDERGIWVSRGCRAEFGPAAGSEDVAPVVSAPRVLRCESSGFYRHCPVDTAGGVRLKRSLSRMDCELGASWGFDAKGVWVARGCRAEFQIGPAPAEPRPRPGLLRRVFAGASAPQALGGGRPLRCESNGGLAAECATGPVQRVELVRQLSHGACVRERTWGWKNERIWVQGGCRAEFLLW